MSKYFQIFKREQRIEKEEKVKKIEIKGRKRKMSRYLDTDDATEEVTKRNVEAINELRNNHKHLLTAQYDTDYNLLRMAQCTGFDMTESNARLLRHLKRRRALDLDNLVETMPESIISRDYFPIGLIG
jgi:hypothetical protein